MNRGFTLVELLITITIFSIVITGFLGLFSSAFKYQKESLDSQYLLTNASYVTEYMSRALRMAKKDDSSGSCTGTGYLNYAATINGIRFLNYHEKCQEFILDGNKLKVGISETAFPPVSGDFLTPTNLDVEKLEFDISGETQEDNLQPKITFVLKVKIGEQRLNLQTTISQRDLDVEY